MKRTAMAEMYVSFFVLMIHFLLIPAEAAPLPKFPAVIVFGDSTVDTGNNDFVATVLRSNFEPYGRDFFGGRPTGRFCNGRLPPDFISEALGLKPTVPAYLDPNYNMSDFAVGVCFASAGTGYDNATSDVLNVIPLWKEVENYKEYKKKLRAHVGEKRANEILGEALYLVSMGTNDFLENYFTLPRRRMQYTPEQYTDFLHGIAEGFVRDIYGMGARKISMTGLPPMGCLPLERTANALSGKGDGCIESYNTVAINFNKKMEALLDRLNLELPGITLVFSNPYPLLHKIVRSPSRYGFEVAARACCGTGTFEMSYLCGGLSHLTCTDANKYVFWDSFHPTERTNFLISDYFINNVLQNFS